MSGPFYGSLAASASVFVAILTALLVNNYVRIKSDRRQTQKELSRVNEELQRLRTQRDNHQGTVDELEEKRESDYREDAKERVDEFIEHKEYWNVKKPIEKLTVDELYHELIEGQDSDSPEELEEEPFRPRHRNLLEERLDEIYDDILDKIIPSFAKDYEGEGWDPEGEFSSLAEAMEGQAEDGDSDGEEDDEPDITVKAEPRERDVLKLEEFIERYKEEHGLNTLHDKTRQALKKQYRKVVDKNPNPYPSSRSYGLSRRLQQDATNPWDPLNHRPSELQRLGSTVDEIGSMNEPVQGLNFPSSEPVLGLNAEEEQKLEEEQKDLREVKNEISILEKREERLERELEGLNPEDLNSTLGANVVTIVLSVVVPVVAYLDTATEFTISQLHFVNIWWIFTSWLIGLIVVFAAIYWKINNANDDGKDPQEDLDTESTN